ncbi:HalOD1 output domain-containing protein [Natronomonas salsuginis]|uniref:HalOD1 output domain-containing protein n=1 Tax=Natronomonas salsuginis TaxID=2217661 RepID=UPI003743A62B
MRRRQRTPIASRSACALAGCLSAHSARYWRRTPHELPPFYEAIEWDAVEKLFCPASNRSRPGISLTFMYDGYTVTIIAGDRLSIQT